MKKQIAGNPIVETALQLRAVYPAATALDILDQALEGHRGTAPDFESFDPVTGMKPHPAYADDTDAGTPFAELLRRAFAPTLDPRELLLIPLSAEAETRRSAIVRQWHEVIEQFAERYQLWTI
jgi:hypothetical protein